jgi:hypothetical protein
MTIIIGLLGYMKIYIGLVAPMMAHFAIDVVLLYKLSTDKSFIIRHFPPPTMAPPSILEDEIEDTNQG